MRKSRMMTNSFYDDTGYVSDRDSKHQQHKMSEKVIILTGASRGT